jgi:hypothetical protein|nr:MAG TPA: hypothetical protein [Caudoviricetes sp.]
MQQLNIAKLTLYIPLGDTKTVIKLYQKKRGYARLSFLLPKFGIG